MIRRVKLYIPLAIDPGEYDVKPQEAKVEPEDEGAIDVRGYGSVPIEKIKHFRVATMTFSEREDMEPDTDGIGSIFLTMVKCDGKPQMPEGQMLPAIVFGPGARGKGVMWGNAGIVQDVSSIVLTIVNTGTRKACFFIRIEGNAELEE